MRAVPEILPVSVAAHEAEHHLVAEIRVISRIKVLSGPHAGTGAAEGKHAPRKLIHLHSFVKTPFQILKIQCRRHVATRLLHSHGVKGRIIVLQDLPHSHLLTRFGHIDDAFGQFFGKQFVLHRSPSFCVFCYRKRYTVKN